MRIAAIDIGSNSIHLLVVDAAARGTFRVLDREKEMVRLGAETLREGRLNRQAMDRGLETLRRYRQLADSRGVEKVIAVATSAVREAANGDQYLARIGRELRLWPRIISGEQEARLIHRAVAHSVHLAEAPVLVIDVGGGSIELIVARGAKLEWAVSEKAGVLRLTETFLRTDPMSPADEVRLSRGITAALGSHLDRARAATPERVVGTSGTILALGALAHELETGRLPETLHHLAVSAASIHTLRERLVETDLRERLKLPGLDAARADIIVAGAVLLDESLKRVGARELTLCEWALREGVLLDYVQSHRRSLARAARYPDPRRRSVVQLAERCSHDDRHARHTTRLALQLFDATVHRHGGGQRERELLEYAAVLHDIGHHISYPAHHKHSYYLIKNGDLHGFDPTELEVLACVARYHRRGRPRRTHSAYGSLAKTARRTVRLLAGLVRLADALDRSHRQVVESVSVSERNGAIRIRCHATADCELEIWGSRRRSGLLERVLRYPIRIDPPARTAVKRLGPRLRKPTARSA
jgi:exopolyphosphatase / guanosine-5'-triphosphate,3'-diphosphate pyrophosphatase